MKNRSSRNKITVLNSASVEGLRNSAKNMINVLEDLKSIRMKKVESRSNIMKATS
jgi:hypothetical protein